MTILENSRGGVPALQSDGFLAAGGVAHGFSTREGGISEGIYASLNLGLRRGDDREKVLENYRRFCGAIGADFDGLVLARQVHGDRVMAVTAADRGLGIIDDRQDYEADGLITDVPGVCLTVFTADCVPVLLYDPVRRVVAAVHAGWRGSANGIVERAVEKMTDHYGCDPRTILAAIGPSISGCCFETDEDVPNALSQALGTGALRYIRMTGDGKFHVDLKGCNALRLERAGLTEEHIAVSDLCTMCEHERFWSHRYTGGERGSQATMIQLL